MPELGDAYNRMLPNDKIDITYEHAFDPKLPTDAAEWDAFNARPALQRGSYQLGDVADGEMMEQYPFLKSIGLDVFMDKTKTSNQLGSFNPNTERMAIHPGVLFQPNGSGHTFKGVVNHELEHYLQTRYGTTEGTNDLAMATRAATDAKLIGLADALRKSQDPAIQQLGNKIAYKVSSDNGQRYLDTTGEFWARNSGKRSELDQSVRDTTPPGFTKRFRRPEELLDVEAWDEAKAAALMVGAKRGPSASQLSPAEDLVKRLRDRKMLP
jgi:hypothetical protein